MSVTTPGETTPMPSDLDELQIERYRSYEEASGVSRDAICDLAREGLAAQWRPIETAPKDGTQILTFGSLHYDQIGETPSIRVSRWHKEYRVWVADHSGSHEPHYWMPLPNPPTPQARGEPDWRKGPGLSHLTIEEVERLFPSHDAEPRVTYPPEMLPSPDEGQEADVFIQNNDGGYRKVYSTDDAAMQEREDEDGQPDILDNNFSVDWRGSASKHAPVAPSPSVVSEGEPTPRTKCEPSGHARTNGLQPQPSVGELITDLLDNSRTPFHGNRILRERAATTLKQQEAEIERLQREHVDKSVAWDTLTMRSALLDQARAEIGRLRAALQTIVDGIPRPEPSEKWRGDGKPSKNDKCPHGLYMYEACDECISTFARAALTQGE